MGRKVAIPWHALFSIAAGVLYFFFVLPRWPELMGDTTHTLGNALRIATGALLALAAFPVVFTLLRTRKPELGTPQLALSMRVWSIVAHVLAGVLIIGTAISEYWLTLDAAGQYLFGIYGAAAAIGVLGWAAFYLSFVAELPPPPPKPIKAKKPKEPRRRGLRRKKGDDGGTEETEPLAEGAEDSEEAEDSEDADDAAETEKAAEAGQTEAPHDAETVLAAVPGPDEPGDVTAEAGEPQAEAQPETDNAPATTEAGEDSEEAGGGLRNRRPTGKGSHRIRRRRTRSGVALDE